MLTRSSIYAEFAERRGIQIDTIVRVTIGSYEYLFSFRPMPKGLNSAPIYPILQSHSDISESINIFSKRFQISDVTISLSDLPFYPADGETPIRASKLLTNINGGALDIYFIAGDEIDDLDDCLHIFSGLILTTLSIDGNHVQFSAKDKGKLNDIILPQRFLEDVLSNVPTDLLGQKIPLVYGEFDAGDDSEELFDYVGTGLAKAIPYEDKLYSRYAVADHDIYAMKYNNELCINFGGPTPVPAAHHNGGTDSGIYYRYLLSGQYGLYLWFLLTESLDGVYDDESYVATDPENACDGTITTKADVTDNLLDNGTDQKGRALWYFLRNNIFTKHFRAGGELQSAYGGLSAGDIDYLDIDDIYVYLYYGRESGADERILFGQVSRSNIDWDAGWGSLFSDEDITSGSISTDLYGNVYAIGFEAWIINPGSPEGDSVLGNQVMLKLGELRVKMKFVLTSRPNIVWIGCYGRMFGSWIDGASRSNNYDEGEYINSPAYIIESLYRDELGLTDDDIDIASFDNAHNDSVIARINIINDTLLSEIARTLSEQSTFVICYSNVGKLRAIVLNESSPDIAATIDRSEVVNDVIEIQKTDFIVNSLIVKSRWQGENSKYIDIDLYEDIVSQTIHRTRTADYKWPNICDDSAAYIAQHYVNSTNGLWSKEHIIIRFKTHGFKYSHLQAGDWVALTSDFDEIREPYGGTWQDKNLLVVGINKGSSDIELKLIEIDESTLSPSPSPSPSPEPSPSPVSPIIVGLWQPWDSSPTSGTMIEEDQLVDDVLDVWCCKPIGKEWSVGIDMGESMTLSALRIYDDGVWGAGTSGTRGLKLYTSNDGTNWTFIETQDPISRVATGGTNDPYYIQFTFASSQTARYFKLYAFDGPILSASGYAILLTEIVETIV